MENPAPYIWPANELEEVLSASLGNPAATPRLLEVLGRSHVWVPLPNGGSPDSVELDLPTMELGGALFVPVFSSEQQFRLAAEGMSCTVAPVQEFARGLPPQLGIAVNPGGAVGVPLPPAAVARLCRPAAGERGAETASGARVRLWEPDHESEPVDFLAAAAGEFAVTPVVLSARRAMAVVEDDPPALFVGVELDGWQEGDRAAALDALGRAAGTALPPWPVHLILLDLAQDPVGDWMLDRVQPFFTRD
ncbi:enhanced serine sensitivity protein SseB [Actinacidiphila yeochonensis]|uniref:enhanced serine sensitivity protein SseB n=1 Tax=Actinacidiphila yeochonensis TaxID=89050 RepID=UPI0005621CE3|nr:enhanced serine sensitivity protein SseB [Actinacidiphila yeochonensis]